MSLLITKSFFLSLLAISLICSLTFGYLTQSNQDALRSMANGELQKLTQNDIKDIKELYEVVEATQALEYLDNLSKGDEVCRSLKKTHRQLMGEDQESVTALYHLAQINRVYKCDFLQHVTKKLESALNPETFKTNDPTELYFAHLSLANAKTLGLKDYKNSQLGKFLRESEILQSFNKSSWSLPNTQGLSLESLRLVKAFASLHKNEDVSDKVKDIVKTGMNKFMQQTYDDNDKFAFVSDSSRKLDQTDLNLLLLQITEYGLSGVELTKDQRVGIRNWFLQKAKLAQNVHQLANSLKALKLLNDIPYLKNEKYTISSVGKDSTKYELVDLLGNPTQAAPKNVKVQSVQQDGKETKDITTYAKFNKDNTVATLTLKDQPIGKYIISFVADQNTLSSQLTITDNLQFKDVKYQVVPEKFAFPDKFDKEVSFPSKITNVKQATDDYFIHMSVSASFIITKDQRPNQVYLSIKKKDTERNLFVNSYGRYNEQTGRYHITFDVSKEMEHLNGEYNMYLHAADYRSEKNLVWDLGAIPIWFKEGSDEGTNTGIKTEYKTQSEIKFSLPPPEKEIIPIIPLIFIGVLAVIFLRYVGMLFTNRANLSKLNFWGILFILNLLTILGIFTTFWFSVKLIPTLWSLLFISPLSFFISYKALSSADCSIVAYRAPVQQAKKRID